jgi:hypothetical protein
VLFDFDVFHIQLSSDKYWICETCVHACVCACVRVCVCMYVCMYNYFCRQYTKRMITTGDTRKSKTVSADITQTASFYLETLGILRDHTGRHYEKIMISRNSSPIASNQIY